MRAKRQSVIVPLHTRQAVLHREGFRCARCGHRLDDNYLGYSLQHRRARQGTDRRPDTNLPVNLVALCGSATTGCHGWVENHPQLARDEGYRVDQCQNPAEVPILYRDGTRRLLTRDYTYAEVSTVP